MLKQKTKLKGLIETSIDYNIYYCHLKPDIKPLLDNTHNSQLPSGQLIAAHHDMATALFFSIFQNCTRILKQSLLDKWLLNNDYSIYELSAITHDRLRTATEIKLMESDFSKFDKSQNEIALEVTILILKFLNVPLDIVQIWRECHQINKLKITTFGISFITRYQRRSGDALTFLGNTLTTMFALAFTHDIKDCIFGIFGGDDSVIIFNKDKTIVDNSATLASIFNLTAKLEQFENSIYFSSKFLLYVNGYWIWVPDPIKGIIRLGRDDMFCREHVECYYISFCDNYYILNNSHIRNKVNMVLMDRYKRKLKVSPKDFSVPLNFITSLHNDKALFYSMYTGDNKILNRKLTTSLKKDAMRITKYDYM